MKNVLKRMGIVATLVGSSYVSGLEAYAQDKPVEAPKPGQKYSVPNDSKVEEEYLPVPPSDSKSVKNSLENKVDKNEPKKERFPYVFIPGKTKDLDEVRIYSDEITQSTKADREKFLNEIKEKKELIKLKGFTMKKHNKKLDLTSGWNMISDEEEGVGVEIEILEETEDSVTVKILEIEKPEKKKTKP